MTQEFKILKSKLSNYKIKIEIKAAITATTVIKNELKYSAISEGNFCMAEPNLDVLPLR